MSANKYSVVMIIPSSKKADADKMGEALGWGPDSFSTSLSKGISFGLHTTATDDFVNMIEEANQGNLPSVEWGNFGLTVQRVAAVLGALIVSIEPSSERRALEHFEDVMSQNGLSKF